MCTRSSGFESWRASTGEYVVPSLRRLTVRTASRTVTERTQPKNAAGSRNVRRPR